MSSEVQGVAVFAVLSGGLLRLSWRSLRVVGSHGFYRFFGWEAVLALVMINARRWLADPRSPLQLASWALLLVSLVLLASGSHLIVAGKPSRHRHDETLLSFEKTTALVTTGIYRRIRHPLYGSLLFLAWGAFLKGISWTSVAAVAVATVSLVATAKADEAECLRYFGAPYREYMRRSRMFVPWLV